MGFFVGFGVTNKDLDIDWKVFTPIISAVLASATAAITALYISNKWSKQKGSELIASESRQVIKDALELVRIVNSINCGFYKNDELEIEFKKFMSGFESVVINTAYIEDCLIDDELKCSSSIFSQKSLGFKSAIQKENKRSGDEELSALTREFNDSVGKLINVLNPYSTFKKTCEFRVKKKK